MQEKIPGKPILLYDGDCGFCLHWVNRWRKITEGKIRFAPYQEELQYYPQISEKDCQEAVQLVLPDGAVFSGAHAVFKALSIARKYRWLHWFYDYMPFWGRISEFLYQWVAHHRFLLSRFISGSVKKCE
jgi:predicted DCC family thiol-disulfide oxidoreductase YuxK